VLVLGKRTVDCGSWHFRQNVTGSAVSLVNTCDHVKFNLVIAYNLDGEVESVLSELYGVSSFPAAFYDVGEPLCSAFMVVDVSFIHCSNLITKIVNITIT